MSFIISEYCDTLIHQANLFIVFVLNFELTNGKYLLISGGNIYLCVCYPCDLGKGRQYTSARMYIL